jgi:hypothetical protein
VTEPTPIRPNTPEIPPDEYTWLDFEREELLPSIFSYRLKQIRTMVTTLEVDHPLQGSLLLAETGLLQAAATVFQTAWASIDRDRAATTMAETLEDMVLRSAPPKEVPVQAAQPFSPNDLPTMTFTPDPGMIERGILAYATSPTGTLSGQIGRITPSRRQLDFVPDDHGGKTMRFNRVTTTGYWRAKGSHLTVLAFDLPSIYGTKEEE